MSYNSGMMKEAYKDPRVYVAVFVAGLLAFAFLRLFQPSEIKGMCLGLLFLSCFVVISFLLPAYGIHLFFRKDKKVLGGFVFMMSLILLLAWLYPLMSGRLHLEGGQWPVKSIVHDYVTVLPFLAVSFIGMAFFTARSKVYKILGAFCAGAGWLLFIYQLFIFMAAGI